jgi:hypothetical protein
VSGTCHSTSTVGLYTKYIAVLMDYYDNRSKGDVERVVIDSSVSSNSYNINAQVI